MATKPLATPDLPPESGGSFSHQHGIFLPPPLIPPEAKSPEYHLLHLERRAGIPLKRSVPMTMSRAVEVFVSPTMPVLCPAWAQVGARGLGYPGLGAQSLEGASSAFLIIFYG